MKVNDDDPMSPYNTYWTNKAKNRWTEIAFDLDHGKVFQDASLDMFQTVA